MRSSWVVIASVAALWAVLGQACFLPKNQKDGARCTDDDECKSRRCHEGYCLGSDCDLNDPSTCSEGWKCVHSPPNVISKFFGSKGNDTCRPLCGSCPGNMHCTKEDEPGVSFCRYGVAPLDITIEGGPAVVGAPAVIRAKIAPPAGRIIECTWQLDDGKPARTTGEPEIGTVFEQGRPHLVRVSCTDEDGRDGDATATIRVSCQAKDGPCAPAFCCADGTRCLAGQSPTGHVCRACQSTGDGPGCF